MTIFLIRHGQTTGDVENLYGGEYDDHLTDDGRRQAANLAEKLVNCGIDILYTSPKFRAYETAEILGSKLGLKPVVIEDFRERNSYGILTAIEKNSAKQQYPDLVEALKDPRATIVGAEDYVEFRTRILAALQSVRQQDVKTAAVITHGGPIRFIFRELLKIGEIDADNCAYAKLNFDMDGCQLVDSQGITTISNTP